MKKFLLSALVLIIFTVYAIHIRPAKGSNTVAVAPVPTISRTRRFGEDDGNIVSPITPVATSTPPPATQTTTPTQAPATANTGRYKNGTYTGSVADAFYGNIQVQVVITGGNITDVIFLQYPSDRQTSIDINSQAMPYLKQEAIQAQSAQVAGVSGATATSQAYIQSLGSALQQAV
jgi:uncharacterized protein with FMN-binding domain